MAMNPKAVMGILISSLVFFVLIVTINTEQTNAVANLSGAAATLIGLVVLVIVAKFLYSIWSGR